MTRRTCAGGSGEKEWVAREKRRKWVCATGERNESEDVMWRAGVKK